jgi:cytochrome c-type biogenesis protein CcmH/NrfF
MLFGNFGEFILETPMQVGIFILWTFLVPLLLVSLLISFVCDSYTRVYEKREIAKFTEMSELIYDLELLLPSTSYRCWKSPKNQFLSFA